MTPEELFEQNQKLIFFVLWKEFPRFVNDEDWQQIAGIGLWKACRGYDESKGAFSSYAYQAIANSIRLEIRARKNDIPTVSLDLPVGTVSGDDCNEPLTIGDTIEGPGLENEMVDIQGYRERLTERQRFIMDKRLDGMSYIDIGRQLGLSHAMIHLEKRRMQAIAEEMFDI